MIFFLKNPNFFLFILLPPPFYIRKLHNKSTYATQETTLSLSKGKQRKKERKRKGERKEKKKIN